MNLRHLSDQELHSEIQNLAKKERVILTLIIYHLIEADRRRLYSKHGHESLLDYVIREFNLTRDQALSRIKVMRLFKELPEIESKIRSGALTLSNLALAKTLFNKEAARATSPAEDSNTFEMQTQESKQEVQPGFSKTEKLEILEELENKSWREAQKIVFSHSSDPATLFSESITPISADRSRINMTCENRIIEKGERLKGLLAHKYPTMTMEQLIEFVYDMCLEKLDPAKKSGTSALENAAAKKPGADTSKKTATAPVRDQKGKSQDLACSDRNSGSPVGALLPKSQKSTPATSRYIPSAVRSEVWYRGKGQCKNCGSHRAVQIDHVIPFAISKDSSIENLRLLCRSCNQRAAIEWFGVAKMDRHLERKNSVGALRPNHKQSIPSKIDSVLFGSSGIH